MRSEKFIFFTDDEGRRITECVIETEQGNTFKGRATCDKMDLYDKRYGILLAFDRAQSKQMKRILANLDRKRKAAAEESRRLTRKYFKTLGKYDHLLG